MNAWAWRGAFNRAQYCINAAVADRRDENLVMRTLRICFPHHVHSLERLQSNEPVVVTMKELPRPYADMGFDKALGFLVFAAATGLDVDELSTMDQFLLASPFGSSTGAVKSLINKRGPQLFVFDDITDLQRSEYNAYFASEPEPTPLHRAMTQLSQSLQRLHSIPGCFIYCTGSLMHSSPLLVTPVMLAPLSAMDVLNTLRLTEGSDRKRSLQHDLRVQCDMLPYLAERAVRVTGGISGALQFLLRSLQWGAIGRGLACTEADIDAAIEIARPTLSGLGQSGLLLQIAWDGPQAACAATGT